MNDHFLSISADLPPLDLTSLPAYLPAPQPVPTITSLEVCFQLLKVKPFKSHGLDGIPNRIIKEFAYELAEPVCAIFNESLCSNIVPSLWKDASIIPIPKTQSVCCEDELRPIALTACLSKILEDFVVKWMMDDIRSKIDPKQFGCLKGSSTNFCLFDMVNNWLRNLDAPSRYLRVCFIDFSKAFDRINHNILIGKLISLGVRRCIIPWICDFLSNRRQLVKIDQFQSAWGCVNGGVPQGTKLGPILFLVMINDLELKSLHTSHWKYVDDLTISESLSIRDESTLQSDLDEIQQWAEQNDMRLNVKKCKEMVISFLRQSPNNAPLCINGNLLNVVSSFKVLGVTLNDHLKWNDNVNILVKKASKRLYILRILQKSGVPPSDLLPVFFALVRLVLEYACAVWHTSLPDFLSNKIELVQKRALRIVYPGLQYTDALQIAQIPRLDTRRHTLCMKTFEKIGEPNNRLNHLLPPTRVAAHGRTLRNSDCLSLPKCRTARYKHSFVPAMCFSAKNKPLW